MRRKKLTPTPCLPTMIRTSSFPGSWKWTVNSEKGTRAAEIRTRATEGSSFLPSIAHHLHQETPNIPTITAVNKQASVPAINALTPSWESRDFRFGINAPMPPIWIPMEAKFAKPQRI